MCSKCVASDRIKTIMKENKLTLEEVAQKLGMSLNTVWRWSAARAAPSRLADEKIKAVFGK